MLSVILYGRNDSYGYNLHKRAALSFNCIAELLNASGDEIIFVDYNTPNDLPTFPEAIQDMLTGRAKQVLRILRVRPSQHERFRDRTNLVALEPVARNVGIQRSNPENRWVLSTNTDMVFVPRHGQTLSTLAETLPDAYYHLPRFEVPEPLWESLDRLDPTGVIATLGSWGQVFHLNEIVRARLPSNKYDGPGDFQLVLRSDLFTIQGFHEGMLLGWHVDSNLAKRLWLLPRPIGDIVQELFGYHCDHTRQVTPAHQHGAVRNDPNIFVYEVDSPYVPDQAESWGLAGEPVEELSVDTTSRLYVEGLRRAITEPLGEPTNLYITGEAGKLIDYSVDHVLPFLAGLFPSYPRSTVLGWFGAKRALLAKFASLWETLGFGRILVSDTSRWLGPQLPGNCSWASLLEIDAGSDVFIFDFGFPDAGWDPEDAGDELDAVVNDFRRMIERERRRFGRDARAPRRFIGVNVTARPDVSGLFGENVVSVAIPTGTRIKHGFISEPDTPQDGQVIGDLECLPLMIVGPAGKDVPSSAAAKKRSVAAHLGVAGCIAYGPYFWLQPARYKVTFALAIQHAPRKGEIRLDVAYGWGRGVLGQRRVNPYATLELRAEEGDFGQPLCCGLEFNIEASHDGIEFRVWSPGTMEFSLVGVRLRECAAAQAREEAILRSP